jgi:S1-C subfamily serine protease
MQAPLKRFAGRLAALRTTLAAAAIAATAAVLPGTAAAEGAAAPAIGGPATSALSEELATIADRVGSAVVGIRAIGRGAGRGEPAAAGVIVSRDGLVLTAAAALPASSRLEAVLPNGPPMPAREVAHDEATGLLVLKITDTGGRDLPVAELGDSASLKPGAIVATLGNPFRTLVRDGQAALSLGVVSAVYRMPDAESGRGLAIETDAAINPGSFGGPLVDRRGRVVGIVVPALRRDRWLGLAAPANDVEQLVARARRSATQYAVSNPPKRAPQLQQARSDERGVLGIFIYDDDERSTGAEIVRVKDGSPASRAGLKEGDIVREIDGSAVASSAALARKLQSVRAGQKVKLTVEREGWQRAFDLVATAAAPRVTTNGGRPFVGVALNPTDDGLFVARVVPDSPADKAGLEAGDKLMGASMGGKRSSIDNAGDLAAFLEGKKIGETITLEVERDGWRRELELTLGARPDAQAQTPPARPERRPPPTPQAQKKPGFLGAYLRNTDDGLAVDGLVPGSAADTSGLKVGDIIANIGGLPVSDLDSFTQAMRGKHAGDTVELGIKRAGTTRVIEVTLGQRPQRIPPRAERPRRPAPPAQPKPPTAAAKKPGYLGVMLEETGSGVRVTEVVADSPAATAGIAQGWMIAGVDGNDVTSLDDLSAALRGKHAGDTVTMKLMRRQRSGGEVEVQVQAVTVTLGERPGAGGQARAPEAAPAPKKPGFLGVGLEEASAGLTVVEVVSGSPAATAGMQIGERLVAVNGVAIRTMDELAAILGKHFAGDALELTLSGAQGERQVKVTLAPRPGKDS